MPDLRQWVSKVQEMGELKVVEGADWDLEIGTLSSLCARKKDGPALLFDKVKGYLSGYRVLSNCTSGEARVAYTLNLTPNLRGLQLIDALRHKFTDWQKTYEQFPSEVVKIGPLMENVQDGNDVDLLKFPTPRWHELDLGRYIGTADAIVTRDPDSGEINVGTYRMQLQNRNTCSLYISPGKHGRIHIEKYHARGQAAPVAVSLGHHPLIFRVACIELPAGSEYQFAGAISQKPVAVIIEEVTGLPVPAESEIVIAGFCPKGKMMDEGPFGEWTGYYASGTRPAPIFEVARVYHRNNPILLGSHNGVPPHEETCFHTVVKSALLHNELINMGLPDVRGVWLSEFGFQQFLIVSIRQRYAGHAKQAALLASQSRIGGYLGRYVVVVDDDIDPTDTQEVLWAICTRSDPEKDIDILRRCWSSALDPIATRSGGAYFNSRAVIDACKPFEWKEDFPKEITISPELVDRVRKKFGDLLR